ncbi:MAG: hypothetical protein IJ013_01090 [Bacteroidaceae bacterium]|nr:hypothetical protein [Bacteroidaceae bacterium]
MNTATLESYKLQMINQVVQGISHAENVEEIRQAINQSLQVCSLIANEDSTYSLDNVHARLNRAEAYFAAGNKGIPHEQVMQDMDNYVESLCN